MNKSIIIGLVMLFSSQAFSIQAVNNYELALKAFNANQIDKAYIYLKNSLQVNPTHLPAKLLLGKLYFSSGNIQATEQELEQALSMGADINLVLPLLGNSLILQKKVKELLGYENQYYNLSTENKFKWHLLRGQAYIITEQPDLAGFEFKEAYKLFPNDTRANNTLATLYISKGMLAEAKDLIAKVLEQHPDNEQAWQLKGELALQQHQDKQAIEYFLQAHQISPEDPKILRSLTMSYIAQDMLDEAKPLNEKILIQTPDDPTANLIKAWLLTKNGKIEEAKSLLAILSQKMSLLDPETMQYDRNTTMLRGIAEMMLGNTQTSQVLLLKHIEETADDHNALKLLTKIYIESAQYDKTLDLLEDKSGTVIQDLELGLVLVQLYLQEDNLFRAEKILQKLNRNFPDEPQLLVAQARIYDLKNQSTLALDTLNKIKNDSPSRGFLLLKGKLLLRNKQADPALTIAKQLLNQDSHNVDALNLAAGVYLATQQLPLAQQTISQILKLDPDNISATFNQALLYKHFNQFDKAQEQLTSILKKSKSHKETLFELSAIAVEQGNVNAAEKWINKLLIYYPNNQQAQQKLTAIYMMQKRWSDALQLISRLLQSDRLNPYLLLQQAHVYTAMNNSQAAKSNFTVVYELWLGDTAKLHYLAKQQMQAHDLVGARKTLTKILAVSSQHEAAKIDLARLSLLENNPAECQTIIRQLTHSGSHSEAFFELKGDYNAKINNMPQAAKEYIQSLKITPNLKSALVKLYTLAQQGTGYNDFITIGEDLVKQFPDESWRKKLLADAYLNHQDLANAEKYYFTLSQTDEFANSVTILNNLAYIYSKTDLDKAYKTAKHALDNGGNKNPSLLDTLGWILAQQQHYTEALAYLREAYVLDSKNPETLYHLGYTLHKLDRNEEAIAQLKVATQHKGYPEFKDAAMLLNKLN